MASMPSCCRVLQNIRVISCSWCTIEGWFSNSSSAWWQQPIRQGKGWWRKYSFWLCCAGSQWEADCRKHSLLRLPRPWKGYPWEHLAGASAKMLHNSSACGSNHAGGVSFVYHSKYMILFRQGHNIWQGAISPPMLKTASVTIKPWQPACSCNFSARSFISLCLYTTVLAWLRRQHQ